LSVENSHNRPGICDSRGTPWAFIEKLERLIGVRFDEYDPCAMLGEGEFRSFDGLAPAPVWVRAYFMNPPYSRRTTLNPGVIAWVRAGLRTPAQRLEARRRAL
jgi:hypothetical protein